MLQVNYEKSRVLQENREYISEYDLSKDGLEYMLHQRGGDWWGSDLMRLIANADPDNLALLEQVYPDRVKYIKAFRGW